MQVRFETLPPTRLAGQRRQLSLLADTTRLLWQQVQQQLRARQLAAGAPRYSVRVYPPGYFERFDPAAAFEKWAAAALTADEAAAAGLETLALPGGLYAVFAHQGPASAAPGVFDYIFNRWLPTSGYALAERPHLEVLPPGYRPDDPQAREEIWVPVRRRPADAGYEAQG